MNRTNTEVITYAEPVVDNALAEIACRTSQMRVFPVPVLRKLEPILKSMATKAVLQPGLSFIALAILISYKTNTTLSDKAAFEQPTAAINKGKESSDAAEINIRVSYRKNHPIAHYGETVCHAFPLRHARCGADIVALEVCAESKLANPFGRDGRVQAQCVVMTAQLSFT
jgi:hypothetical protein